MPSRTRRLVIAALAASAAIAASGCVGATDRADFDREVQRRGGGVSADWLSDSLDALAAEVGADTADDVVVMSINATPSTRSVIAVTRRSDRPDFVDTVSIRDRAVATTAALPDADRLPLDDLTVRVGALPLERVEELADQALQAFDADGAYVDRIVVAVSERTPTITLRLSSERTTGEVVFDANGELVEVTR